MKVGRGDLSSEAWARIVGLLPTNGRRGKQWRDHRQVVNGILWKRRTGAPWRDLPGRYGPWQTCYDRFARWRRDGTWDTLLATVLTGADAVGAIEWEVCVDSTTVRAHQHAAGARHQSSISDQANKIDHLSEEALGRSRGGLTTKVHLACDGRGRPVSVVLTPGQRHDSTQLGPVLDAIRIPRPHRRGRPRRCPDRVIADKGYSYPTCRRLLLVHVDPYIMYSTTAGPAATTVLRLIRRPTLVYHLAPPQGFPFTARQYIEKAENGLTSRRCLRR